MLPRFLHKKVFRNHTTMKAKTLPAVFRDYNELEVIQKPKKEKSSGSLLLQNSNQSELTIVSQNEPLPTEVERLVPGLEKLTEIKPWRASLKMLDLRKLTPALYETRQRKNVKVDRGPIVSGVPVLNYGDTEWLKLEFKRISKTEIDSQYITQRFCCASWPDMHLELKALMKSFLSEVEDLKVYATPLCEAIVTKRLELHAFLEASNLFKVRLVNQLLLMRLLHQCAVERNVKDYGYLKNRTFVKGHSRMKLNIAIVERTKVGFEKLLGKVVREMSSIEEFAERCFMLFSYANELRILFGKLDSVSGNEHVMTKHILPLRDQFEEKFTDIFELDLWQVFREFLRAWEYTKKDVAHAKALVSESMELVIWSKLALMQVDKLMRVYSGRFAGDEIPAISGDEEEKVKAK